ncbi:hypothetical protein [Bacillus tropicus]|uniref:hypothetical protein n=1 Tax=Bacillus tropicus TaxID=2026188 RepID=UPI0021CF2A89|nr:hypothetical protein [Bacillus tropicus]MCU5224054.1 hypothetical protein [Bacillus tropicus]
MRLLKRKEKLIETPLSERICKCGYPIAMPPRTMYEGFGYKRIIREHTDTCIKCGKINKING